MLACNCVVLALGIAPVGAAWVQSSTLPGGVWCNVSVTSNHTCRIGFFGGLAGSTTCTAPAMQTTHVNAPLATTTSLEIASTDDCNKYTDNLGYVCENYSNEPTTPICTSHTVGIPW